MTVTASNANFIRAIDTSVGGAAGPMTVVIPTDVPAGATIIVGILNRTDETTTVTTLSDPVNGSLAAGLRQGPTNTGNGTLRTWIYAFTNSAALSGAGNRTLTIDFSATISAQVVAGWLSSDQGAMTYDAAATVFDPASTTNWDSNNVAASAEGVAVGFMAVENGQAGGITVDGAGETHLTTVSDAGSFRTNLFSEVVPSAGNHGFEITVVNTTIGLFHVISLIEPGGDPAPSITDVDEDNTVTLEQANISLDGTAFDTATVDLEQGAATYSLAIDSQSATEIVFDMEAVPGVAPKHGAATIRVTNGDDQDDTQAITIAADAATDYVDIATVSGGTILEFSPALDTGDQVQWRVTDVLFDETDFNVNNDGTFDITSGLDPADVEARRWDATNRTWSDWATIQISVAEFESGEGRARDGRRRGILSPLRGRG